MIEIKTTFEQLSSKQKESINTLYRWLQLMYSEHDVKDYYTTWKYLGDIMLGKLHIKAKDFSNLKELWDIYTIYKKSEDGNTKHNN